MKRNSIESQTGTLGQGTHANIYAEARRPVLRPGNMYEGQKTCANVTRSALKPINMC